MNIILLSGGSGKRLWPLSNESRSKQFLKVLQQENGNYQSMIQRVWNQLSQVGLNHSAVISTSNAQKDMVRNHIGPEVPLIIEPERRDTFPAIALSSVYLFSTGKATPNEIVAVLPVDPYVESTYFDKVKELESVLADSGADLALMGVRPTYPAEKYGYIVPDLHTESNHDYYWVRSFREKPDIQQAENLIRRHALWNCGVFAFRLNYLLTILKSKGLPLDYGQLAEQYHRTPKISFDYEVVEKADRVVVLPYDGYWKDLGTWNTLTDEMATNLLGKGKISEDSENVHLINELDIPVVVLGASNLIVAASPDGILVADKEASPRLKDEIDFVQRPMYEERYWGWYKVLDYAAFGENSEVLTRKVCIHEGKYLSYQVHRKRNENWTFIRGRGLVVIDDQVREVSVGDVVRVPAGTRHAVKAVTELEFIEVQDGTELIEEDTDRIAMEWNDILKLCRGGRETE